MDSSPPSASKSAGLELRTTSHSEEESAMKLTRIGVDIAKQVFQLHGIDRFERTVWGGAAYPGIAGCGYFGILPSQAAR